MNPNSLTRSSAWPITVKSDVSQEMKVTCQVISSPHNLTLQVEIMDILITAMEKFHWDHTSISDYLKRELDTRYGCSWHVVAGEEFGFDIDFEVR